MLIRGAPTRTGLRAAWLLLPTLAFGLGLLVAPRLWHNEHAPAKPLPPPPPLRLEPSSPLPLLQVSIAAEQWQVLAKQRDSALAAGYLIQDDGAVVPATVRRGDEVAQGTARLKGDLLDHLNTDQWSLRFDLLTPLAGLHRFSVMHPQTRGYVMEWLVMKTARYMDVLAPRVDFVHVAINGAEPKIYYLEEHASKELLESQGRRQGPIVRFNESAMWGSWMQYGFHHTGVLPADVERTASFFDAKAEAFGEASLQPLDGLNARLLRALHQARDLQSLAVGQDLAGHPIRQLLALENLEGRTIDDLFAVDRLGKWLALTSFFGSVHGLLWNQMRFYYDPVLDRLEPMAFDTGSSLPMQNSLILTEPELRWFRSSPRVMAAAYQELGRMIAPERIAGLREALAREPGVRYVISLVPGFDPDKLLAEVFDEHAATLRTMISPKFAAGFSASVVGVRPDDGQDLRAVEVDAWATTQVPTQLSAFHFGNGKTVAPATVLVGLIGLPDSASLVSTLPKGAVLLPADGRRVRFRFPVDERLAGLGEIELIKRAIRRSAHAQADVAVAVSVAYRTVTEAKDRDEPLALRRVPVAEQYREGRPRPPDLAQALERHPFLSYDLRLNRLSVGAGRHAVTGDLHLPEDHVLQLEAGAEILLAPGATFVAGALQAEGTKQKPVRIGPQDPALGFAGLLVLGTAGASQLQFAEFSGSSGIDRSGWQATGGITFTGAAAEFRDCAFTGARGEDSINLIGVRFRFERCRFDGGPSDLFDGDFVTGDIVDCSFANSGEDAIDISGSLVTVRGCTFENIGDKAFSVGEGSNLTAVANHVRSASIAVASKDRSEATVDDLTVDAVLHYVAAAYVKKPEFGPSHLVAKNLHWTGTGKARYLAQTGCSLAIDGVTVATEPVDIEALYRQKVLGK